MVYVYASFSPKKADPFSPHSLLVVLGQPPATLGVGLWDPQGESGKRRGQVWRSWRWILRHWVWISAAQNFLDPMRGLWNYMKWWNKWTPLRILRWCFMMLHDASWCFMMLHDSRSVGWFMIGFTTWISPVNEVEFKIHPDFTLTARGRWFFFLFRHVSTSSFDV